MPNRNVIPIKDAPPGDFKNLGVPASRLAALAQAGLAIPEGFVVSQEMLNTVLDADTVAKLRDLGLRAGKADEAEGAALCREAGKILGEAGMPWETEMELAKALEAMPQGAWLAPSQEDGGIPVFAPVRTKNALIERVREIWATVLDADSPETWHEPFSPVVAMAAQDFEVSGIAELATEGRAFIDIEAVFGLPQAMSDRKIARDKYRWSVAESRQLRADVAKQRWQYSIADKGVSRVDVSPALGGERKLSEDALAGLASAVQGAADALDGAPAVVWAIADDEVKILWVLDLKPYERRPKKAEVKPAAAPVQAVQDALPVTATKLMVSAEVGSEPPAGAEVQGAFPISIDSFLKANLLAHPQSPEGASLESFKAGLPTALESYAKAMRPRQVVVSLSNLSSEEFAALPGGGRFEPAERNPLMGFRGSARHLSVGNDKLLDAELSAIAAARQRGARNLSLALPFVRTTDELLALAARARSLGLERGQDFKLWMFVEVPSNVFMAEDFANLCDGLAIRLEPLYQLLAAVDPGSAYLADAGFARPSDEGARRAVAEVICRARSAGKPVVICGEKLHEAREVLETAIREGVDAVSAPPQHLTQLARAVAGIEQRILLEGAARLRSGGKA
ncbi:MAG: putative PEP-binding protein [Methanobacteriota archaeon]